MAPGAGLAWVPFASSGTVVRAGFGLFYDRVPLSVYSCNLPGDLPNRFLAWGVCRFPLNPKYAVRVSLVGYNLTNHFNPITLPSKLEKPQAIVIIRYWRAVARVWSGILFSAEHGYRRFPTLRTCGIAAGWVEIPTGWMA